MVTHDLDYANDYGERVIELKDGEVVSDNTVSFKSLEELRVFNGDFDKNRKVLRIPKGTTIKQDSINHINDLIRSNPEKNLYITLEMSDRVAKLVSKEIEHVDDTFDDSQIETINLDYNYQRNFHLIESKLPFKNSFKMALGSIWAKKFKLLFAVILFIASIGLFGFSRTITRFDFPTAVSLSYEESGTEQVFLSKQIEVTQPWGDDQKVGSIFTTEEVEKLTTSHPDLTYGNVFNFTKPSREEMEALLGDIQSGLAYEIAESEYVIDYNFSFTSYADAVDFEPVEQVVYNPALSGADRISVNGTFNPRLLSQFGENGTLVLTDDSTSFIGTDSHVTIISYDLAYENNLDIGDSITVSNGSESMTLEVIGIFQDEGIISGATSTDNQIFMPLNDALELSGQTIESNFKLTSATYFLDDPLHVDDFIVEQEQLSSDIADEVLVFSDDVFEETVGPIEHVGSFSDIVLVAVVIAAVVILSLIVVNTLKDKKYEIGVLMSLGENKIRISMQYIFELLVIAVIAFSASIFSSNMVSNYLGGNLLDMQLEEVEASSEEEPVFVGRGRGSFGGGTATLDVEYIDEIDIHVSLNDFIITLGLGMAIVVITSIFPTVYITRFKPKTIFASRN